MSYDVVFHNPADRQGAADFCPLLQCLSLEFPKFVSTGTEANGSTMTTAPGKAKAKAKSKQRFSDAHLVAECLKGKETAWSSLIEKYKNLIFSIPIHYGFTEEDSADIFQSVCMDLLTELPRLREPNALAGWLIQVARNKCFHKKQALSRSKVQEIGDLDPPAPVAGPENLVSQAQQEQRLRDAIAELPARCRNLLNMLFFETPPRPYEEIAKELELPRGSIGFARKGCLDKLRERMENSSS
jgi:RNA polymerase sigma factor (sigma-70 family)